MLYLTKDLIRKPNKGVPVTLLGRTVYWPTGAPVMAMRTGAPIVVTTWHYEDGLYHIHFHEPMDLSGRGDRQRRAAASVERFAEISDQAIRRQPEIWWNWLDKRWTWLLRGQLYVDGEWALPFESTSRS